MKIYNTTTGKVIDLTIIDVRSGIEWTADLITAGSLPYNEDHEATEMSQEDIDWWRNVIEKMESNDEGIVEIESNIIDQYELDDFREGLADCQGNDLDTDVDRVKKYLDEFESEG